MSTVEAPAKVYLCPELAGTLMTPEEFDAVEEYDEDYRYELVHGVLVVVPIPLDSEMDPNDELGHMLRSYHYLHPQGRILDATLPERYVRTRTSRRKADRVIWAGLGRLPDTARDVPTIAVEFVSRRRRDRRRDYEDKRQEYMEVGVAEYGIIDRFQRTLTVVRNTPNGPQDHLVHEGEAYTTPLLPGFELPLARLLAQADRWDTAPEETENGSP
jgi:Uma2 family endonuclease